MNVFRYHAARAGCRKIGDSGLMEAAFSGPLCARAFSVLTPQVLAATGGAEALLIRMDACLTVMSRPLQMPDDAFNQRTPDGCIVVRADQLQLWVEHAADMALRGVRRVVFLDSQLPLVMMWLERRSSSRARLTL